ncbi:3-isopropylmalate dehydrogenase [Methanothermus fervidus DSM 2088]|uniref:3-isopropylmalate dehydrogenase n=1 Tax=Methanothermus fervidus (strain ATCC 43054 / DSM 2088 / JCM 10308 / V24 S) TaxID=523846 RepID=E3GX64_METFV|nr:homoisocitrate dehydrogenase [Methanothermus fervidus]ADP78059.1 3-isopropylmalate dehydrogenase [Methanothermus fervidus DSM 2088]
MGKKKVVVIKGDGIGKEVMDAALSVLSILDLNIKFIEAYAGYECFKKYGDTLPDESLKKAKKSDAILFGAVTTVPGQKSAIITLRKELDLFANVRPVKCYPGIECIRKDIDLTIVRENTECLYSGIERYTDEGAEAVRVITRKACERICEFAFKIANEKVTAVHKANVLKKTDGLFREVFYEVAEGYPEIEAEDVYVDAMALYLITKPQDFDVLVTTNLYGDILSDEAAGLVGGLGLAPSANIGEKNSLFEPVHGSAPDIAGKGIANPTAMILSSVMMLRHLGFEREGDLVENALIEVLREGKVTPDLGGNLKTMEMAEEIKKKIMELS